MGSFSSSLISPRKSNWTERLSSRTEKSFRVSPVTGTPFLSRTVTGTRTTRETTPSSTSSRCGGAGVGFGRGGAAGVCCGAGAPVRAAAAAPKRAQATTVSGIRSLAIFIDGRRGARVRTSESSADSSTPFDARGRRGRCFPGARQYKASGRRAEPLLKRFEEFRKCGRERGGEAEPLAGRGVVEAEPLGVEELAAEGVDARAQGRVGNRPVAAAVVGLVADDGVIDPREVDAYLVRAAGLDLHVQQREAREAPPHAPERDGHARAVARVARERLFDPPFLLFRHPVRQRDVGLEDRALAELVRQTLVRA